MGEGIKEGEVDEEIGWWLFVVVKFVICKRNAIKTTFICLN